jgi:membrane peptidoglycan carboxypeptidase
LSKARRNIASALRLGSLFTLGFLVALAIVAWPRWRSVRLETEALADAHQRHNTAHPGWSFPARVWSAPASLDLPPKRLVAQALARDYAEACPPTEPGQVCKETGEVIPRGGVFAEGVQPPGVKGWTRPVALEPILVGTLTGPDAEIREHLPLHRAPKHLIAALLAAEDEAYYEHPGVNVRGIARAMVSNLRGGGPMQGASTITMQVVRNLSQRKDRSLQRKVREAMSAVALDQHLGKDAVLQMYLDAPYLGQHGSFSICGFQAAAQFYYGVDAEDLDLPQAATLASILPAPGRYSPERHPDAAVGRRNRTLALMAEQGWPRAEINAARAAPETASVHPPPEPLHPPYLQATRAWLEQTLDPKIVYGAGLEVFTAMDVVAQRATEASVPEGLRFLETSVGRNGKAPLEAASAVVSPETGLLVAAWGGSQDLPTDFNRATQARRQSGSSIKPLVYAMAFSQLDAAGQPSWRAHHTVRNDRHVFKGSDGWYPRNVGGKYTATTTLAMGLSWSQNVAAASLLEELGGPKEFKLFAQQMGFDTTAWRDELGLALGSGETNPLEMARFVATVLADGALASGRPVQVATDAAGVVRVPELGPRRQALTPESAALTRDLMRLVIEYGTGGAARGAATRAGVQRPAVGKTGTTDSEKDLWFVGGTADYAGALWIGYDQPTRIGTSASDLAAPLWGWWMRAVHKGLPSREFESETKTRGRGVCTVTGGITNESCRTIWAPFLEGDRPTEACEEFHPPPDPTAKKYEGLWKRKAREEEEAAALDAAPLPTGPAGWPL